MAFELCGVLFIYDGHSYHDALDAYMPLVRVTSNDLLAFQLFRLGGNVQAELSD